MIYEDQVVDAVCAHLVAEGWAIEAVAHAHQHGDDIVATRDGVTLRVEAKGEGSSKPGTARFGKPFDSGQRRTAAAKATFRALGVVSAGEAAAIAFPATSEFDALLRGVLAALIAQGVTVYLVDGNSQVSVMR